jgi:hypothetical protein
MGWQVICNSHWFIKDEEAINWREGFPQLPLDTKNKLKEGSWKSFLYLVFFLGRGGK